MRRTKYPELGYERVADDHWRFVDTATGRHVGPAHPTEGSLLADLDREAGMYGHDLPDPPPIDMVLPCPRCGLLHIDRPDPPPGAWANPPHKSHLCRVEDGGCGHVWRPADVATNGVAATRTRGEKDGQADDAEAATAEWVGVTVGLPGEYHAAHGYGGWGRPGAIQVQWVAPRGKPAELWVSAARGNARVASPTRGDARRLFVMYGVPLVEARPCAS